MAVRNLKRVDQAGDSFSNAILDSLSEAVVVVDGSAMVHYANLSAEQFFGVGRALGVLANITWDRGLGYAIERPKSVTTDMLEQWAKDGGRKGAED